MFSGFDFKSFASPKTCINPNYLVYSVIKKAFFLNT